MSKANKGKEAVLPSKLLKELLRYEYETGLFIKVGQIAGCLCKDGYVTIGVNSHNYKAHRLAWVMVYGDYPDGEQPFIDHINGKRGDNRIENLRIFCSIPPFFICKCIRPEMNKSIIF